MAIVSIPDLNKVKRVLIIRLSSIGDVANALPVAAALKDSFPHLELTWIVEEMSAEIVTGSPCLENVIVIPRNRWKQQGRLTSPKVWREYSALLRTVRSRRFDVTLDLQGYAKSAFLALASGAAHRFGWQRMRDGAGLVSRAITPRPESIHRVELFLDVPRALGACHHPVRFPLYVPPEARARASGMLAAHGLFPGVKYVVINPAVGSPNCKWSAENYGRVAIGIAERLHLAVVLVGSAKDREICGQVRDAVLASQRFIETNVPIVDLSGETSIKELAAVLEGCVAHICGDTGSAHIAAALSKPVVALYGPTDPKLAGPWLQTPNVLAHREHCVASCSVRRCAVSGAASRDGNHVVAKCLSEITPEEVLSKVGRVIDEG